MRAHVVTAQTVAFTAESRRPDPGAWAGTAAQNPPLLSPQPRDPRLLQRLPRKRCGPKTDSKRRFDPGALVTPALAALKRGTAGRALLGHRSRARSEPNAASPMA
ncbi:hypothetical protein P7K49_012178 [Saguinus oedipus]|uniref:Uncharacterized protein n=1 Tax=Saguinus oedipus TaxID=9490 RepID=A0ABQ9VTG0_SAGOE|nr:hypothetical protein P7K49_012178 [Saguinus oedipus]